MTLANQPITNQSFDDLSNWLREAGEPQFRFTQIITWLYCKRVNSFEEMRNTPKSCRAKLADHFTIEKLPVKYLLESGEGDAVKFGFAAGGGDGIIESVLLYDSARRSLCVSSQLGCNLGCVFCETGTMGFIRNLTLGEIIGQVIAANDFLASRNDKTVTNVIFMGMGEALANFGAFSAALEILSNEHCFGIGNRRITVSTAGVLPSLERLLQSGIKCKLAVSLNAWSNEMRDRLMPVNRKYPIERLIEFAHTYRKATGTPLTFEYVLIHGETDTDEAARALVALLRGVPCKINCIPLNPSAGSGREPADAENIDRFVKILAGGNLYVTVRKSRGRDIHGACGQLAGRSRTGKPIR